MTFHQNLPAQKPQAESEPRSVYRLAYDEFAAWATGGAAPNSTPNGNRRYSPPARARIPHRSTSAAWARPLGTPTRHPSGVAARTPALRLLAHRRPRALRAATQLAIVEKRVFTHL